jgi:hypothetical protein
MAMIVAITANAPREMVLIVIGDPPPEVGKNVEIS